MFEVSVQIEIVDEWIDRMNILGVDFIKILDCVDGWT